MRSEGFCTTEVSRLSGMSVSAVRALARAQVVGQRAGRALRFDFRDVRVLRMGAQLVRDGLSIPAMQQALQCLHEQAQQNQVPLSSLRCSREQSGIVATDGESQWVVADGQARPCTPTHSPASVQAAGVLLLAAASVPATKSCQWAPDTLSEALQHLPGHGAREEADQFFTSALAAEDGSPQEAYALYMRALACDPEHVEAIINVGRLCFADDDLARAASFFRLAVRIDGAHPIAHFNLAVALHDSGRLVEAAQGYRRALLFDRNFADAHFNLGTLLEKIGRRQEAQHHFAQYRAALMRRS